MALDPKMAAQMRLELEARGIQPTTAMLVQMNAELDKLRKQFPGLSTDFKAMIGVVSQLADKTAAGFKKSNQAIESQKTVLAGLEA